MTATLICTDGCMTLEGMVGFHNAAAIYQQGSAWLRQQHSRQLVLDLSGLQSGNTVTLAVMMQWLRQLRGQQQLKIAQPPPQLQAIIQASNLDILLT
jgi:phospholipid transport system transporter-binding protein